jgi:hypothetical protein
MFALISRSWGLRKHSACATLPTLISPRRRKPSDGRSLENALVLTVQRRAQHAGASRHGLAGRANLPRLLFDLAISNRAFRAAGGATRTGHARTSDSAMTATDEHIANMRRLMGLPQLKPPREPCRAPSEFASSLARALANIDAVRVAAPSRTMPTRPQSATLH